MVATVVVTLALSVSPDLPLTTWWSNLTTCGLLVKLQDLKLSCFIQRSINEVIHPRFFTPVTGERTLTRCNEEHAPFSNVWFEIWKQQSSAQMSRELELAGERPNRNEMWCSFPISLEALNCSWISQILTYCFFWTLEAFPVSDADRRGYSMGACSKVCASCRSHLQWSKCRRVQASSQLRSSILYESILISFNKTKAVLVLSFPFWPLRSIERTAVEPTEQDPCGRSASLERWMKKSGTTSQNF